MLVTMLFQTLYFLVDLYWVGRLGKEAVAGVGVGRQPHVPRARHHADARRRHDDADLARGGPAGSRPRAARVQSVAGARGGRRRRCSSSWRCRCAARTRAPSRADPRHRGAGAGTICAGSSRRWRCSSASSRWARRCAASGSSSRGWSCRPRPSSSTWCWRRSLMFGWFTGRPLGVAGTAIATFVAIAVGTVWLARYFFPADSFLRFHPAGWKPQFAAVARDAQHRPAGGRRVRADGAST